MYGESLFHLEEYHQNFMHCQIFALKLKGQTVGIIGRNGR